MRAERRLRICAADAVSRCAAAESKRDQPPSPPVWSEAPSATSQSLMASATLSGSESIDRERNRSVHRGLMVKRCVTAPVRLAPSSAASG